MPTIKPEIDHKTTRKMKEYLEWYLERVDDIDALVILTIDKEGNKSMARHGSLRQFVELKSKMEVDVLDMLIQARTERHYEYALSDLMGLNAQHYASVTEFKK